jgi:hypothetical protein
MDIALQGKVHQPLPGIIDWPVDLFLPVIGGQNPVCFVPSVPFVRREGIVKAP